MRRERRASSPIGSGKLVRGHDRCGKDGCMPLDMPPPQENRFGSPLELSRVHWVRPEVVVEVIYLTWTEGGLLRAVSYQGQREDKTARQVVRKKVPGKERVVLGNISH
jgi:ATP-dependent DNA ligase